MGLTNKQRKFINEYLKTFNATEAAIKAGYSERSARAIGSENLTKPDIWKEIEAALKESAMSAEEVLMRLADTARSDIGDFSDIKTAEDLANHPLSRLVKKFKRRVTYDSDGNPQEDIEIELYDSQSALTQIGKYWSLFVDRVEHTGKDGQAISIKVVGGIDLDDI